MKEGNMMSDFSHIVISPLFLLAIEPKV